MKTLETIKQEFENATGMDLPIYTYKGKLGVICDDEFVQMEKFLSMDSIDFDRVCWVVVGADACEEGEEITDQPIANPENNQKIIVDAVWSPVTYQKSDEYVRELLVTTDQYYDWTSERRRMIDCLYNILKRYDESLDTYSDVADADLEDADKQERDALTGLLKDRLSSEKKSWEETCSEYEDACGWEEFSQNKATFSSVMQEVLKYEFCTLVCKVADEFVENNN